MLAILVRVRISGSGASHYRHTEGGGSTFLVELPRFWRTAVPVVATA